MRPIREFSFAEKLEIMTTKLNYLLIFTLCSTLFFSCNKDEDQDEMQTCQTEELHECVPYDAQTFTDSLTDSWTEANEEDTHTFISIPASELGGGVVTITLESPGAGPAISVWESGLVEQGASIFTSGAGVDEVFTAKFTAYPGKSYTAIIHPSWNPSSFPSQYTLTWTYEGKMDCYEHNDTWDQAKFVPKNLDIEARVLTGHIENGVGSLDDVTFDWYKFVLDEPSQVQVLVDECPEDIKLTTRIFDEDQNHKLTTTTFITGSGTETGSTYTDLSNDVLNPGTYWLEVHSFFAPQSEVLMDDPDPDHWSSHYNMKVTTVD